MKNKKKSWNKLEQYVAKMMHTRPTTGSGAFKEIGDVYAEHFFVECKQKSTKTNFILNRKEWLKLQHKMPTHTDKLPIWVIENKYGERVVIFNAEDFFRLNN